MKKSCLSVPMLVPVLPVAAAVMVEAVAEVRLPRTGVRRASKKDAKRTGAIERKTAYSPPGRNGAEPVLERLLE